MTWLFVILIILFGGVYFAGTSSAFLKSVILPRVSKSMNADITVADASIHPFKEVILHNLTVKTTGDEPLVTAPEVHAKYSLLDMIGGKIHVDLAELNSPKIVVIQNADGTSNLDPLTKGQAAKPKAAGEKKTEQPGKPSKPPEIDIKKVALNDATIRQVKIYKNGNRDLTELSHVNVTLDDLKNGQTGKLTLNADVKMESNPPDATNGVIEAKAKGNFSFALGADLKPSSIQGNTHLDVTRAGGGLSELGSLAAELNCDVTPTEIKQVGLHFAKGVTRLGEVRVNGPFDMNKMEGKLTAQVLSIDKQVLNLASAASGIDFGSTTVNSTNEIVFAKSGSEITVVGGVAMAKMQLTRAKQTTPTLDLVARYNTTVYQAAKTALLREFTLNGTQKGNQLIQGELTSPMTFAWGESSAPVGDSTLTLAVNGLDLADWKPFLGDAASSGNVNVKMQLLSQQAGKQLTFNLNSQVANLTANISTNQQLSQANVSFQMNGRVVNLNQVNLTDYQLQLAQQNQTLLTVSGAGSYDKAADTADLQVNVKAAVAKLLQVLQPDAVLSSGNADLTARLVQRQGTQGVTGKLALADLTGKFGNNQFNAFGATMELDVAKTPKEIQIHRVAGTLTENGKPGGNFDVSGTYGTENKTAQLTAKLSDFNQDGVRAFLEPMLADKKLVSIAINGTANVQLNPQGDSAVKADVKVANLVVSDPKNQIPATPLEAKLAVDASVQKQVADVRQFQITLTPTQRAKNELQLKGRVDMTDSKAIQGNVKLLADSLDFTSYYDLFAGESKAPEKKPAPASKQTAKSTKSTSAPASAEPQKEPDAVKLPLHNFTAEVNIGHCYLREVDISNLQTTTKIDGSHIVVKPLQLALNGAPVNANVDLDASMPGYKYDTSFGAQAIPLAPLVNTFTPERKGQIGGTLTANAKITGAGMTDPSLKKNLAGQFDVTSTNLNLSIVNIKSKILKGLVNVIGAIPELITNPGGLVETATGKGGLSDELAKSPLDSIDARGEVGSGKVNLQKAVVQSAAFLAEARGTVTLADVLTNSALHIPVSISLNHSIAKSIGLASADTSTNTTYVKLPDFYTEVGTVGVPKPDINNVGLAKLGGKAIIGIGSKLGGSTGQIFREAGNLFGTSPGTNSQTSTNQPADKSGGLLKGLGGVLSGALGQTNAPSTNRPKR